MKTTLLLLTLLCAAASANAEQVYKWTDAAGIVHYSDSPPPSDAQNVQTVRITGGDRPHSVPTENNTESGENKKADTGGGAAPTQPGSKTDDVRSKNCQTARANLEILQSNYPVAMGDSGGKALDDKGRQSQITEANAQIAFYCR
jgi:hypothetical protein